MPPEDTIGAIRVCSIKALYDACQAALFCLQSPIGETMKADVVCKLQSALKLARPEGKKP